MAVGGLGDCAIVYVLGAPPEQLRRDGGSVGKVARRQEFRAIATDLLKMRDLELVHILATPHKVEVVPILPTKFLRERPVIYRSDPREIIGCGDLRYKQEPVLSEGRALLNCQNQGVVAPLSSLCPSATACSIARPSLIFRWVLIGTLLNMTFITQRVNPQI